MHLSMHASRSTPKFMAKEVEINRCNARVHRVVFHSLVAIVFVMVLVRTYRHYNKQPSQHIRFRNYSIDVEYLNNYPQSDTQN